MHQAHVRTKQRQPARRIHRTGRGFSLVEMLMALAISALLLTSVFVALDASFKAYQVTTEVASTHTISRLTMHRMLSLIRTGRDFAPFPNDGSLNAVIESDFVEFYSTNDVLMRLEYVPDDQTLYLTRDVGGPTEVTAAILEAVTQDDGAGNYLTPFVLEFESGSQLYRATIDLTLVPDDNMSVSLDGDNQDVLRLVASAMPRDQAYGSD